MYRVMKRNGAVVDFDLSKITTAITKAFEAEKKNFHPSIIDFLGLKVTADFTSKLKDNIVSVEQIQDSVERVLCQSGYEDVAKAYILYRKQHENVRNFNDTMLDYKKLIEQYKDASDWRVKENSTVSYSLGGLILNNSGAVTANYWLSEIYDKEVADAHRNGDMHIHDLSMLSGYCFTGDTRILSVDGRNPTFRELTSQNINAIEVYAYNPYSKQIVIATGINPRVTRSTTEMAEVLLSNKEIIRCTPDHPFMLKSGDYVEAKDLMHGDQLQSMPSVKSEITVLSSTVYTLPNAIPVYDLTVPMYHNFILNAGVVVHNCAGWNLKDLIMQGLGGVPGKISSSPAKHLSTLCNQMVNFLGILQNEWAGAQAFSSVDTYLAPFIKKDDLSYREVKQCVQNLIFGLNTPSRWGCVTEDTEILTIDGFKKYHQLKKGDKIYSWKNGKLIVNPVNEIIIKNHTGKIHTYKTDHYIQQVSPEHRMLITDDEGEHDKIVHSEQLVRSDKSFYLPVVFNGSSNEGLDLEDEKIVLASMVYSGGEFIFDHGSLDHVNIRIPLKMYQGKIKQKMNSYIQSYGLHPALGQSGDHILMRFVGFEAISLLNYIQSTQSIDHVFAYMNTHQARLFLEFWLNQPEHFAYGYKTDLIRDQLQQICLLANYTSYNLHSTSCIKVFHQPSIKPQQILEEDYDGIVWCPNVDSGTAVFRKDGCVYISGNCQAPFTNFTLDWTVPEDLRDLPAIVGGEECEFTYGDCKKEMDMFNRAFIEVMVEGDSNGRGFQYPIPTYSITKDFDWSETENNQLLFEMTSKYGTPYFSNYVNSDMKPQDIRSMCCRLRLSLSELRRKNGGYFGSGDNTGSVGVVTLNLPRLAYLSENENDFYQRLDKLMDIAARSLKTKRTVISDLLEQGMYPYTKHYLGHFNNHFSTIGLVGMNEAGLNAKWLRADMTSSKVQQFAKDVLNHMRNRLSDYQVQYGDLYNLEATPAESTSYRFAKHDKEKYPDIITASDATPYYTNSSHLPVGYTDDLFSALDIQDELQTLYTSGTVFHGFLGEKLPDWKSAMRLVKTIAENYKLPYYTLSPTYSVCCDHGYLDGEQGHCPVCGQETEVYSRITGYYRPVQNWNAGKAQEFKNRKTYTVSSSGLNAESSGRDLDEKDEAFDHATPNQTSFPDGTYLITTPSCPNCKMVKHKIQQTHLDYQELNAYEHEDLCIQLGVYAAPTLIQIINGTMNKASGVADILKRLGSIQS